MSDEHFENEKEGKGWLNRVAEQSWEPELLISGLAIYATLQLPEVFESALYYYQYNLQTSNGFIDMGLPTVIIASVVNAIKLLNYAFILHFIIRAFWVGVIGLNSVFPKGIQYDKLQYSGFYQKEMEKRIGQSGDFLMATDRLASVIFSVTFTVSLLLFAIGFLYSVFFLFMNVMKMILPENIYEIYSSIFLGLLFSVLILVAVLSVVLNMERFRSNEKITKWHFLISWYSSTTLFPFVFKPFQYLLLNFMSNIPLKKYYTYSALFFLAFMCMLLVSTVKYSGIDTFTTRSYFSTRSFEGVYNNNNYDVSLTADRVNYPVMDKKIYEAGSYAEVFLPYPKMLDTKLKAFCELEEPADSLFRFERRAIANKTRLACVNEYFSFALNDSLPLNSELMFTTYLKTDQHGFGGKLWLDDTLNIGKYTFNIRNAIVDEMDERRDSIGRLLVYEFDIPIWIE
jgi:hypothetical protein